MITAQKASITLGTSV
ncbi:hypothetical protein [Lentibacillus juripiscarius]|uniref:Uncharacterized protein n=1 Tax=Lentibacillus juripiscarius TaxID=257446 RepID=A0ABW5V2W8_9BACI